MYDLNTTEFVWTKIKILVRDNGAMKGMSFQALQLTERIQ